MNFWKTLELPKNDVLPKNVAGLKVMQNLQFWDWTFPDTQVI